MGIFWRSLDLPLICCRIELNLSLSKHCVISEISKIPEVPANPAAKLPTNCVPPTQTTKAKLQINNAKFYVPEVILFAN